MKNSHKQAVRNLALSPAVGVGCVAGGAALGTLVTLAGLVAGLTAPVWYPRRGYRQGAELDAMEELLGPAPKKGKKGKAQRVEITSSGARDVTMRKRAAALLRTGAGLADESMVLAPVPKALAKFLGQLTPEVIEKLKAFAEAKKAEAPAHG